VSIILGRVHGHKLLYITTTIAKIFVDYDKKLLLRRGVKEGDEIFQTVDEAIQKILSRKPDMVDLVAYYALNVKGIYEQLYRRLNEDNPLLGAEHPYWGVLRELHKFPESKYLKFNTLSQFLFIVLDGMDTYTRYPIHETNYTNIAFLKKPEIREACSLLAIMVADLISLVPLVWNKIEYLAGH
jgi:hypothetical protein